MSNLHRIYEWEEKIPKRARFDKVSFNREREVTKVEGQVKELITENGYPTKWVEVKVHWDGFGKCYVAKKKRKKNMDINF